MENQNQLPKRDALIQMIPTMSESSTMSQAVSEIFTKILSKEIDFHDENIEKWLKNDFGYFLRKLREIKVHSGNEAQEAQTIFLSFINLVKNIGIHSTFLHILRNFFDRKPEPTIYDISPPTFPISKIISTTKVMKKGSIKDDTMMPVMIELLFQEEVLQKTFISVIENPNPDLTSILQIVQIFTAIEPYLLPQIIAIILYPLYDKVSHLEFTSSIDILPVYEFLDTFASFVPEKLSYIIGKFTHLLENNPQNLPEILTHTIAISDLIPEEATFKEMRAAILKNMKETTNPLVFLTVDNLIENYNSHQLFDDEDLIALLFDSHVTDRKVKAHLVYTALDNYEIELDDLVEEIIDNNFHSASLELALIGSDIEDETAMKLFQMLLNNYEPEDKVEIIEEKEKIKLNDIINEAIKVANKKQLEVIVQILVYLEMFNEACTLIEKVYTDGENYELVDAFRPHLGQCKNKNALKTLISIICDKITKGVDDELFESAVSFVIDWVKLGEASWLTKLVEPILLLEDFTLTDPCPPLLDAIFDKVQSHNRSISFLMRLVQRTVEEKHCYWLIHSILKEIRNHPSNHESEIEALMRTLFELFRNPKTNESAAQMIYIAACLNADARDDCCGVFKKISIQLRGKEWTAETVIHPMQTCWRLYYTFSQVNSDMKHYNLYVTMPDGSSRFLNPAEPLSAAPIALMGQMEVEIVSQSNKSDGEFRKVDFTPIADPAVSAYLESELELLSAAAENDDRMLYVLTLLNSSEEVFARKVITYDNTILYPFYVQFLTENDETVDIPLQLQYAVDNIYNEIGVAILMESIMKYDVKVRIEPKLLEKCIFNKYECVREATKKLGDFSDMKDVFISLLPLTTKMENRAFSREFFIIIDSFELNPITFESFFQDLEPYETGGYPDATFIGLLKHIPHTPEMCKLVYERLFQRPPTDNPYGPFVISDDARDSGYQFLLHPDNISYFSNMSTIIPVMRDNEPDDLLYYKRTGVKNLGATCYASAILQALNTFPRFMEKILTQNEEGLPTLVNEVRKILGKIHYIRGGTIDPYPMLKATKGFSVSAQQDTSEWYSEILSAFDDAKRGITDTLRGTIKRSRSCDTKPPTIIEEPFYILSLRTKGLGNTREAFERCFAPEVIQDARLSDGERGRITEQISVSKWPMYLAIQLQRWEYDISTMVRRKLTNRFEFPLFLSKEELAQYGEVPPPANYMLSAVIVHLGTAQSGHYVTLAEGDGKWYRCNDGEIIEIDISEIPEYSFGVYQKKEKSERSKNKSENEDSAMTAYMIFYRLATEEAQNSEIKIDPSLLKEIDKEAESVWPNLIFNSDILAEDIGDTFDKYPNNEYAALLQFNSLFKLICEDAQTVAQQLQTIQKNEKYDAIFTHFLMTSLKDGLMIALDSPSSDSYIKYINNVLSRSKVPEPFTAVLKYVDQNSEKINAFVWQTIRSALALKIDWSKQSELLEIVVSKINDEDANIRPGISFTKACSSLIDIFIENFQSNELSSAMVKFVHLRKIGYITKQMKNENSFKTFISDMIANFPEVFVFFDEVPPNSFMKFCYQKFPSYKVAKSRTYSLPPEISQKYISNEIKLRTEMAKSDSSIVSPYETAQKYMYSIATGEGMFSESKEKKKAQNAYTTTKWPTPHPQTPQTSTTSTKKHKKEEKSEGSEPEKPVKAKRQRQAKKNQPQSPLHSQPQQFLQQQQQILQKQGQTQDTSRLTVAYQTQYGSTMPIQQQRYIYMHPLQFYSSAGHHANQTSSLAASQALQRFPYATPRAPTSPPILMQPPSQPQQQPIQQTSQQQPQQQQQQAQYMQQYSLLRNPVLSTPSAITQTNQHITPTLPQVSTISPSMQQTVRFNGLPNYQFPTLPQQTQYQKSNIQMLQVPPSTTPTIISSNFTTNKLQTPSNQKINLFKSTIDRPAQITSQQQSMEQYRQQLYNSQQVTFQPKVFTQLNQPQNQQKQKTVKQVKVITLSQISKTQQNDSSQSLNPVKIEKPSEKSDSKTELKPTNEVKTISPIVTIQKPSSNQSTHIRIPTPIPSTEIFKQMANGTLSFESMRTKDNTNEILESKKNKESDKNSNDQKGINDPQTFQINEILHNSSKNQKNSGTPKTIKVTHVNKNDSKSTKDNE